MSIVIPEKATPRVIPAETASLTFMRTMSPAMMMIGVGVRDGDRLGGGR